MEFEVRSRVVCCRFPMKLSVACLSRNRLGNGTLRVGEFALGPSRGIGPQVISRLKIKNLREPCVGRVTFAATQADECGMTVDVDEIESSVSDRRSGGEVSALTLIEDVRAIRQRLDGVEVALRSLDQRLEQLPGGESKPSDGAAGAPGTGDLPAQLQGQIKTLKMMLAGLGLVTLAGMAGLGWMLHQFE